MQACGFKSPEKSSDGTQYKEHFVLTKDGEPIGLTEHSVHIAEASKTHVIQLFDHDIGSNILIKEEHLHPHEQFEGLFVLPSRPGHSRVSFVSEVSTE